MLIRAMTVFCRRQITERDMLAAHRGLDRGSRRTRVVRSLPRGRRLFRRISATIKNCQWEPQHGFAPSEGPE